MLQYLAMQNLPKNRKNYATMYIVRHGETDWNAKRLLQGHVNKKLNKAGEEQAKLLGEKLKHVHFDAVFSSDLIRAKRTAELILLEKKMAILATAVLRERSYGKFEGKPIQELRDHDKKLEALSHEEQFSHVSEEGIENDASIMQRFIPFLREIAIAHAGKTVLIVSHGGVLRVLLIHLGFWTRETLPHGRIGNTAYVRLLSDGVDFFIEETEGINIVLE